MRPSRPTSLAALAAIVGTLLSAGCSSVPTLRVKSLDPNDHAKVYFKPSYDAQGREIPLAKAPETFVGETPTEFVVPEDLRGARGIARLVYADGLRHDVRLTIQANDDTTIKVSKPRGAGPAR